MQPNGDDCLYEAIEWCDKMLITHWVDILTPIVMLAIVVVLILIWGWWEG